MGTSSALGKFSCWRRAHSHTWHTRRYLGVEGKEQMLAPAPSVKVSQILGSISQEMGCSSPGY